VLSNSPSLPTNAPPAEPVAVLIANWNTADLIVRCVESVRRHVALPFEMVVVDNGSTDVSVAALERLAAIDPRVRLIRNPRNYGYAHANNQALAASQAQWVVLLNSDIVVAPGVIEELIAYLRTHPRVGLVTSLLTDADGRRQAFFRRFPDLLTVAFRFNRWGKRVDRWLLGDRFKRRYLMSDMAIRVPTPVDQAGGACIAMRRGVIEKIGGLFDERFPLFFNDVDLSLRVWKAGLEVHVLPLALEHGGGRSVRRLGEDERRWWLRSGLRDYYAKHGTRSQRLAVRLLLGRIGPRPANRMLIPPDGR